MCTRGVPDRIEIENKNFGFSLMLSSFTGVLFSSKKHPRTKDLPVGLIGCKAAIGIMPILC
jgi:hypothetical protein